MGNRASRRLERDTNAKLAKLSAQLNTLQDNVKALQLQTSVEQQDLHMQMLQTEVTAMGEKAERRYSLTQAQLGKLTFRVMDLDNRCQVPRRANDDSSKIRLAILVFPNYEDNQILIDAHVVPKPFKKLNVSEHIQSVSAMLQRHNFFVLPLEARIRSNALKEAILAAVECQPSVLTLVFCGHGATNHNKQQQVLLLSGGDRVSISDLDSWLAGFNGTLIQLFNMCCAAPLQPVPANQAAALAYTEKDWAGPQAAVETSYRRITFYSSAYGESQYTEHAPKVFSAFVEAANKSYLDLQSNWPGEGHWEPQPTCCADAPYAGRFPGPARLE